jgi:hypothetical protein
MTGDEHPLLGGELTIKECVDLRERLLAVRHLSMIVIVVSGHDKGF